MFKMGIVALFVSTIMACTTSSPQDEAPTSSDEQQLTSTGEGSAKTNGTRFWTLVGATESCLDWFGAPCPPQEPACPTSPKPVEGAVCNYGAANTVAPCAVWKGGATFAAWYCG